MKIFDIEFKRLNFDSTIQQILLHKHIMVNTINNEFLLYSLKDSYFKDILNKSDIKTCDSTGLFFAFAINDVHINFFKKIKIKSIQYFLCCIYLFVLSFFYMIGLIFFKKYFYYTKYGDRIPGTDIVDVITSNTKIHNANIYIIGSSYNACKNFEEIYRSKNQYINKINFISFNDIVSNFNFTNFDAQILNANDLCLKEFVHFLINEINTKKIDYVYIALAAPQSVYIANYIFDHIPNVGFVISCGGAIDYLGGVVKRAPKWMRNVGLEFLYRLYQQPVYRYKRIYNAVFVFWYEVIKWKLKELND